MDFADVRTVMSEMGMAMMGTGIASGDNRAREATEAAISSPLLEDINLDEANSIGEFQEVGEMIKDRASVDATVVVGTVIDDDMANELRVTVVATGLGQALGVSDQPVHVVRTPTAREPNYSDLEKPAIQRKRAVDGVVTESSEDEEDLLNIPAFLRRQAD